MKLILSEPAWEDMLEIWEFIASDNLEVATSFIETFQKKFDLLLKFPQIGKERPDFGQEVRTLPRETILSSIRLSAIF